MSAGPVKPGPAADVASALTRERPDLRVTAIAPLGEGVKSEVWRISADGIDDFALKIFRPKYRGSERTELAFHEALGAAHADLVGMIPQLLFASDGEVPMIATSLLEGEQLLNAGTVDRADRFGIYRGIGMALAVLHRVDMPAFGALPLGDDRKSDSNAQFMTERWTRVWNGFRDHGGNDHLAMRAWRYLSEREELWDTCGPPRLCHGDAHPGNVLVARTGKGLRFVGLLDFESAAATDPVYDFAAASTSLVDDAKSLVEALVEAHGEPEGPWRERLAMYALVKAMSDWSFYAEYVARAPQRECERRMIEITESSRMRVWRSAARRALTGRRARHAGS